MKSFSVSVLTLILTFFITVSVYAAAQIDTVNYLTPAVITAEVHSTDTFQETSIITTAFINGAIQSGGPIINRCGFVASYTGVRVRVGDTFVSGVNSMPCILKSHH